MPVPTDPQPEQLPRSKSYKNPILITRANFHKPILKICLQFPFPSLSPFSKPSPSRPYTSPDRRDGHLHFPFPQPKLHLLPSPSFPQKPETAIGLFLSLPVPSERDLYREIDETAALGRFLPARSTT